MPDIHNPFGGSTISRTLKCPAWRSLADQLPRPPASDAANDGTQKHTAMEVITSAHTGVDTTADEAREMVKDTLTEEQVPPVLLALDAIREVFDRYAIDDFEIEPFVELVPGIAGGSIDLIGFSGDSKKVIVVDYKFGHMTVKAEESPQHLFYHLCADADPRFQPYYETADTIVNVVIQPNEDGDVLDVWEAPIDTLDDFSNDVFDALAAAQAPDPEAVSGKWCQFCPARAICPVLTGAAQKALTLDPDNRATLVEAMQLITPLSTWIKAVGKLAHEQMELGVKIDGYKLVAKRPVRKWDDEYAIMSKIKKMRSLKYLDACDIKLKSPAQMEKHLESLGKDPDMFANHISSISSGSTVVPESDKRPELLPVEALKQIAQKMN
jgi:hypothetical protein